MRSLETCGVVHMTDAIAEDILTELAAAFRELYQEKTFQGISLASLMDSDHLRAGREEIWLPFVAPFSKQEFLRPPRLWQLIQASETPLKVIFHLMIN